MQFIDLGLQQERIRKNINDRINAILDHGKYIMGPEVFELEDKLANYVSVKNCISCSSGTDALLMPLLAKGVGKGDAVITTPFTYIATAEVISLLGAVPIFSDIYPTTFNIDPDKITESVHLAESKGLIPKAIIAVNIFGLPARYRLIKEVAKKHNLFIIEDAAQSFGSKKGIKNSGALADVSSTSFFPAKPLGCYGDGGAIFTDDDDFAENLRSIRIHGSGSDKYDNVRVGINGRLDTIQAAILLEKLSIFDQEIKLRNQIADYYKTNLNKNFRTQIIPSEYLSSWAQFSILAETKNHREKIIHKMQRNNIPIMVYYKIPLHLQKVFEKLGYNTGDHPISEMVSNQIFSIPMHPYLTKNDQDKILEILNNE